MKLFSLPKPVVPNALEMYAVHSEKWIPHCRESGKISDSYTIVPQYKGKLPCKTNAILLFWPEFRENIKP
jgi:hypothetical protein